MGQGTGTGGTGQLVDDANFQLNPTCPTTAAAQTASPYAGYDAACVYYAQSFAGGNNIYLNTANTRVGWGWGGILISSVAPSTAGTAVVANDASGYYPNYASNGFNTSPSGQSASQDVTLLGYGFKASTALGSITAPASLSYGSSPAADAQGAFWALSKASTGGGGLGDVAVTSTSVSQAFSISGGSAATTVLAPSFNVLQWVYLTRGSTANLEAFNFNTGTNGVSFEAHGFQSISTSVTVDGTGVSATGTTATSGFYTGALFTFPDIAYGSHTVTVSDGTYSASDLAFVLPAVAAATVASSTNAALSLNSGAAGSATSLRTGTTFGVHGLKASTTYGIYWGLTSTTAITPFTTNTKGQIAAPGVSFTVPSGTTGTHIFVIRDSTGADVLFNDQAIAGYTVIKSDETPQVGTATYQSSLSTTTAQVLTGQYMDLLFSLTVTLSVTPTVGNVGTTLTLTGTGLSPTTTYYVDVSTSLTPSTATQRAVFTTDASGNVPSGTALAFPALATSGTTGYPEQGTTFNAIAFTATQFLTPTGGGTASGTFVLQSAVTLSSSTATPGSTVTLTATGLLTGSATYAIVFGYAVTSSTTYSGTTVGAFTANSVTGGGTQAFTVPSYASAGAYTIQLVRISTPSSCTSCSTALGVLAIPPTLTVTTAPTGAINTSTFTTSGTPTESVVSGQATVSGTFTNQFTGTLSVYMWVSVKNAAGQTVGVFLGSATVVSGATVTIGAALFNLPSGSYTASVFLTTTTGVVASTTSTTASFSV